MSSCRSRDLQAEAVLRLCEIRVFTSSSSSVGYDKNTLLLSRPRGLLAPARCACDLFVGIIILKTRSAAIIPTSSYLFVALCSLELVVGVETLTLEGPEGLTCPSISIVVYPCSSFGTAEPGPPPLTDTYTCTRVLSTSWSKPACMQSPLNTKASPISSSTKNNSVESCRRQQAALHGASGATRQNMLCPQRRCADIRRLLIWRVT